MGRSFRLTTRYSWLLGCLGLISSTSLAKGQIVPDSTLPNNTVVIPNGNITVIEQGTRVGSNLFHSFQEFSIPTGGMASFNNAPDIQNIISRITGGTISNIDGTLQANGSANLFLINPNGIIFGRNAQLSIGGSFIGSTANSIKFANGSEFSAINPQAPPLLAINVPVGLQFGSNPGKIVNQSQANSNTGLQVPPLSTLALVGGDVLLDGGNLTAIQGQIALGSVASSGTVNLAATATGLVLGYEGIQSFGNIVLSGAAAANASGLGGGTIQVRGGQVALTQGSRLMAETFGNFNGTGIDIQAKQFSLQDRAFVSTSTFGSGAGGNLTIHADAVEVTGTKPFVTVQQLLTGMFNPLNLSDGLYSLSVGSGTAGNISIDTGQLRMQNGANLLTTALLSGNGGNITIKANALAELSNGSLLFTGTAGAGNAGDITVTGTRLQVLNGTSLSTTPGFTSTGTGGDLTVSAQSLELRGTPAGALVPGGLFTTTLGTGSAGDISVMAGQVVVADGAQISTSTSGYGRGGKLSVTADSIELSGRSEDGRFLGGLLASSSLLTVLGQPGNAPAGDLVVTTRQLSVRDGAQISAATGGVGAAGNLTIVAESVEVSGYATGIDPSVAAVAFSFIPDGKGKGIVPSAIETNTRGKGNAGDLTIQAGQLTIRDRAEIGVRSTGLGKSGNLSVTANSVFLDNGAITATSILGKGGDIQVQAQDGIVLRDRSSISTRAGTQNTGGGDGGNIIIDTGVLAVVEASNINANAFSGTGGNIQITTKGLFVSPESFITASSALGVNGFVQISQIGIDPSRGIVKLPENFTDASQQIATSCATTAENSFVVTGRGGLPEDPTQTLRGRTVWRDLRPVVGRAGGAEGAGGARELGSLSRIEDTDRRSPVKEAQGWVINARGQVELVANAPQLTPQTPWSRPAQCSDLQSWHPSTRVTIKQGD